MINNLITSCFYRRHFIWIIYLIMTCIGFYAANNLLIEAYTELGDVVVKVSTQVPGLAAEEIEQQITRPLELALSNTPNLVTMRSTSTFALSLITLIFKEGTEDYFIRERVRDHINEAILPDYAKTQLDVLSGTSGEIYRYTLQSASKNLMQLSEIQRWMVIPKLRAIPGIADVSNFGGYVKQFELELDPMKLQKYDISILELANVIQNNTQNGGGGRISWGSQAYVIRSHGQIHNLTQLGEVVVKNYRNTPIYVKDLGLLKFGFKEREGIVGKDNNHDVVEGIVQMLKYQNPSEVLDRLHIVIDELNHELANIDVKIVPYIDRDELVHSTVHKVRHTVLSGIFLVALVLLLFLGNIRSALITTIAIPVSLITIFIIMAASNMSANLFSLGAIDFGVIVDGAIVVMEAILRQREEMPLVEMSANDAIKAANYVGRPIFFSTLIIISAYLPLFAFEHAEGKLFTPMAYAVSFALLGALVCALTLIPGLAYEAFKNPKPVYHNKFLEKLTTKYIKLLSNLLQNYKLSYWIGGGILLLVLVLGSTAGREFLPNLDEGALWLQVDMPTGLSLEQANKFAGMLRKKLLAHSEVKYIVTQLGRSDAGTDAWTPSHIEAAVGLTNYNTWPKGENKAKFIAKLHQEFAKIPGFAIGITQPIIDNVNEVVSGSHSPLALQIFSHDLKKARALAIRIMNVIKKVPGTASVSMAQGFPIPQVEIKIDRIKAAHYGISTKDIAQLVNYGLAGLSVVRVYQNRQHYEVTVRYATHDKDSKDALGNLYLKAYNGAKIYLSQLADIRYETGESAIAHEAGERNITIKIDNHGRDLTSYFNAIQTAIKDQIQYNPKKIKLVWGGQFKSQKRAEHKIIYILFIMLFFMAMLLFFQFKKLRYVFLILGVVPMATLGGLIAVHVTGETINVATAVGFIALFGVSVQNGIIMIANIKRHDQVSEDLSIRERIIKGAEERLRPVLMTATVASFGMLPAALATGIGTDVQRGLATVVVGGLIISTALTLFILPTYYYCLESWYKA